MFIQNNTNFSKWASLVAQMVKNLPVMRETWVQSLGSEDPLEEGMATHSSILAWRIPMDRGAWRVQDGNSAGARRSPGRGSGRLCGGGSRL